MPSLAEILSTAAAYRPNDPSETPMVLPPGPMGWYQGPPHQGFEDWLRSRPDTAPSLPTAPGKIPPGLPGLRSALGDLLAVPPAGGPVPRLTPEQLDVIQGPQIDRRGQGEQHKQRREFTL